MKLTSSILALTILSLPTNSVAIKTRRSSTSSSARQRMLAKNEARILKNGNNGKYGQGNSSGQGNTSGAYANTGNTATSTGKKAKGPGHSASMDKNDNGIHADATEYEYGEAIGITFDLTDDVVDEDVRNKLTQADIDGATVALYMRMANIQGGTLEPILTVTPTITNLDDSVRRWLKNGTGNQGNGNGNSGNNGKGNNQEPAGNSTGTEPEEKEEMEEESEGESIALLNFSGKATITATDAKTLNPKEVGTGFDGYLINPEGLKIMGPVTFYMTPTKDMVEQEEKSAKAKPTHPLARHDHTTKKHKTYGPGGTKGSGAKGAITAKGMGFGSGSDGNMIIGTAPALAKYSMSTDQEEYADGDTVKVFFDIGADDDGNGRRLKNSNGKGNNGNGNGNGGGNSATTTQATTTAEATTTEAATEGTTTEAATEGATNANSLGEGTTTDAATETPTTTTTLDADIDMGANDLEQPATIDPEDRTLWSIGVFMKMANPQCGDLEPIASVKLCSDDGCAVEDIESGEVDFIAGDLKIKSGVSGFDLWILNGLGCGVAGPVYFSVE